MVKSAVALAVACAAASFGQGFAVRDPQGALVSFNSFSDHVTVVTFISTQCPISNAYNGRMIAIYQDYSPKGVQFIFVNANRTEPAEEVARHAKDAGFPFPVYKDTDGHALDRFDAQVTPESFVIDSSGKVVYHGQVDDSRNEARVKQRTLRLALDAVLAGKPVPAAETKAFGCTIKRPRRTS